MAPTKTVTQKSEPVKTFHEEEKDAVSPAEPLNEEPAMNKAPVPDAATDSNSEAGVDEDREYEMALKAVNGFNARFEGIESTQKAILETLNMLKSNYTSKPAPRDSDYPTPPEDGPLADGIEAPRLTQQVNPHVKPFGKDNAGRRNAGGAADGSKEFGMKGDEKTQALMDVLTGRKSIITVKAASFRGE